MSTSICEACRALDFSTILKLPPNLSQTWEPGNPAGFEQIVLDENANRLDLSPIPDCPCCDILTKTLCPCEREWASSRSNYEGAANEAYILGAYSFLQNCKWASNNSLIAQDCHILLATRGIKTNGHFSRFIRPELGYVVCLPKGHDSGVFVPKLIPNGFDHTKIKLWLRHCKTNHEYPCIDKVETVAGMKLIDCETSMIVGARPGMAWVSLSYVWDNMNSGPPATAFSAPNILRSNLPLTVQHAIQVTRRLGFKYLWIDRYCIDQQDETHKPSQIAVMDAIYRGAELTLIAATTTDGLPGVGTTKRKKQSYLELDNCTLIHTGPDPTWETQNSRWWTRGWTFQEGLLSRRRLIFTDYQSWFECGHGSWMEALGGLELLSNPETFQWGPDSPPPTVHSSLLSMAQTKKTKGHFEKPEDAAVDLDQFFTVASIYSGRDLKFDSDVLNAFSGTARYLRNSLSQINHLLGIPYVLGSCVPSHAEEYFFFAVSWLHSAQPKSEPRRRPGFPSWTWIGWVGSVRWMTGRFSGLQYTFPMMRNIRVEEGNQEMALDHYLKSLGLGDPHLIGETNIVLCFEAQLVPPSEFRFPRNDTSDNSTSSQKATDEQETEEDGDIEEDEIQESCYDESDSSRSFSRLSSAESSRSTASEPDPSQWENWQMGKHSIWDGSRPPDCEPQTFLERLETGRWGCLLLGDYDGNGGFSHRRFLLIIEWLENGLAQRVGALVLNNHPYYDVHEFFEPNDFEWKSVRLV
ncbi:HET-domain-containing protein [Xylariaceae sp. FL1019]|nr:HET-domain-containing protein [Xylariaceae sp. FL1019]